MDISKQTEESGGVQVTIPMPLHHDRMTTKANPVNAASIVITTVMNSANRAGSSVMKIVPV